MSKKYSKQKNVIYEICNEPNGCSWSTIRSYAAQVIKIIRNKYLPDKLVYARKKNLPVMVTEFGMSAVSGGGGISTSSTGKWLDSISALNTGQERKPLEARHELLTESRK